MASVLLVVHNFVESGVAALPQVVPAWLMFLSRHVIQRCINRFEGDLRFVDVSVLMSCNLEHLAGIARVYSVLS
jgi:hypothetical protein